MVERKGKTKRFSDTINSHLLVNLFNKSMILERIISKTYKKWSNKFKALVLQEVVSNAGQEARYLFDILSWFDDADG